MSARAEGNGRWKRIRGALFHSNSRSFSPRSKIASIDEGLEIPPYSEVASVLSSVRFYLSFPSQWEEYE